MTEERLLAFAHAWSNRSLDAIMEFFTEDCIYRPSVTSSEKQEFSGKEEVRCAIGQIIRFDDAVSSCVKNIKITGDFGFWEWEYLTANKGNVCGCDSFKFRNDSIIEKNAFRRVTTIKD